MRVTGSMVRKMVRAASSILTEVSSKVSLRMEEPMGMELILTLTVRPTPVNGFKTSNTAKAKKCDPTAQPSLVPSSKAKRLDTVNSFGQITTSTKATSWTTKSTGRAYILGMMGGYM